jgi:hypothetical protein
VAIISRLFGDSQLAVFAVGDEAVVPNDPRNLRTAGGELVRELRELRFSRPVPAPGCRLWAVAVHRLDARHDGLGKHVGGDLLRPEAGLTARSAVIDDPDVRVAAVIDQASNNAVLIRSVHHDHHRVVPVAVV